MDIKSMNNTTGIDESQYSRQLHTFGAEAQKALECTSILISGLSGLGIEIAKCIIMTGVKSVTLHDTKTVTQIDLSSNYYATENDVGKLRTDVVKSKLASLNPKVNVIVNNDLKLTESHAKRHQVVVICDSTIEKQIECNTLFRQYGTKFIFTNTFGLFGNIFCDFGDEFVVNDVDGESPATGILTQISNGNFISSEPHKLYVGDLICLNMDTNLDEVDKIIDLVTFKTKNNKLKDQLLNNTSFTQQKQHLTLNFKSLEQSLESPDFSMVMIEDFDRQRLLHDFFIKLGNFVNKYNRYPDSSSPDDEKKVLDGIEFSNEVQANVVKKIYHTYSGKLIEIDSIIASIVGQEVVKAASKKYTPIKQWLYIDISSMLPDEFKKDDYTDFQSDRYLGRNMVIGKTLQKKIMDSSVFLVGAGAIGCEHLKNLAMMGVGTTVVTDMDTIEKSNLNRQFLFRNSDIGKLKSESAKNAIMEMNPHVKVIAQQNKVCNDTLKLYNEKFFSQFSSVLTALDNVDARLFVDNLCLQNCIPLIDAGTLGTKCNVQIVVPHLTETYGQSRDPPEKEIPMCTLKNFPYLIEHCIQWARDLFEGLFVRAPQDFMQYKSNPQKYKSLTEADRNQLTEVVNNVNFVKDNIACHIKECIQFAYKLWHEHFRDQIYYLIQKYPINSVTSDNLPFWTGTKKFPTIGNLTGTDVEMSFLESVTNLWANVCGIKQKITQKQLQQFLKKAQPPKIDKPVHIIVENENKDKDITSSKDQVSTGKSISDLVESLPEIKEINDINVYPLEFEKDDDTNFHIDFVTSASNSRAINYNIPIADKFKTKCIAGKIIPAIITTTSLVSGLAMVEFIKVLQRFDKVEQYSNVFVNLSLPVFAFSDPIKISKIKAGNFEYSIWDRITFDDMTIEQLIKTVTNIIKDDTKHVVSISSGSTQLFSINHSLKLINKRKSMKITDIHYEITQNDSLEFIPILLTIEKIDSDLDSNSDSDSNPDLESNSDSECDVFECRIKRS